MLQPSLREMLEKQATAFTHEVAGLKEWETLQTRESCAKGSSQAKTCQCLSRHPEDLFLRPQIQPVNNLIW